MISRYTVDHWAMVCCSSTWESADRLTCCPTMSPQPWRPGFREHPGANVVARDRGLRIRDGVSLGAPNAIQVTDRFHLLRNVVDALDQLQRQRRAAGSAAFGHGVRAPPVATPDPPPLPDPTPESKPGERWRSYRAGPDQWERARALRAQGWSILTIGREVSLSPKTVRRLLDRATPPS